MPLSETETTLLAREWILMNEKAIRTSTIVSVSYSVSTGLWTVVTAGNDRIIFKNIDDQLASEWCWAVMSASVAGQPIAEVE